MKQLLILVTFLFNSACHGIMVARTPSYEQVLKMSKLIGAVKIIAVRIPPKKGFTAEAPDFSSRLRPQIDDLQKPPPN